MSKGTYKFIILSLFLFCIPTMSYAQANSGSGIFSSTLLVIAGLLFLAVIFLFGENLLQLEAKRAGIKSKDNNFSILPGIRDIFREKLPDFVDEDAAHVLKKGFDIQLEGDAAPRVIEANIQRFALKPQEFNGISPIPKVEVTEGDTVKAGDVLADGVCTDQGELALGKNVLVAKKS